MKLTRRIALRDCKAHTLGGIRRADNNIGYNTKTSLQKQKKTYRSIQFIFFSLSVIEGERCFHSLYSRCLLFSQVLTYGATNN